MYFSFTPKFVQQLMPQLLWRMEDCEKSIFLTFDDGPIPEVTPWVLDQLNQYNAKASFFCVGENIDKYPAIFEMIKSSSHCVCNHTYNHLSGWSTSTLEYVKNVEKTDKIISNPFFRPPYGRLTPSKFRALKDKYQIVMWDVLSGDFDPYIEPQACYENVIKNTLPGSIIVFHDSLKAQRNLEYTLPRVLEYYSKLDFSFESLENVEIKKLNPSLV